MKMRQVTAMMMVCLVAGSLMLGGCSAGESKASGSSDDQVIIYSNADEEAVDA